METIATKKVNGYCLTIESNGESSQAYFLNDRGESINLCQLERFISGKSDNELKYIGAGDYELQIYGDDIKSSIAWAYANGY